MTCPECGRTGQLTLPKNDRDAWKGKLVGTGDGPRLPPNPPQRLSDDPKLMEAMERRDGSLLLTDGGEDVDPHAHEYRAAFFDHPNSRSSEAYGAWKTWSGLVGAMERELRDGDANLVSIREVPAVATDGGHELLDELKRRSVEQRERLRQLLRGRHGRHGVPYRVGRVCACCEAPRAFTYVRDRPITTTTGAWGKYVEPVYRCRTCRTLHSGGFTEWGPVVPEASP